MKALILGGTGMLGHKLWQLFANRFEIYTTLRHLSKSSSHYRLFDSPNVIAGVSAQDFDSITRAIAMVHPDVVVNCIGIVKQDAAAKDPVQSISINALFPHRLAHLCRASNARLIHISTDCVFTGQKGNYLESDPSDATDLYGRTKFLGEVGYDGCLTLRTSIIGHELGSSHGLIGWFLSQVGKKVSGYTQAIFTGFPTVALAEIIARMIVEHPDLSGVWQVASEPISKFDLLSLVKQVYDLDIEIEPDEQFFCDRSLNAERFRQETGIIPDRWPELVEQMYNDSIKYLEYSVSDSRSIHANG